jgi:nodulation protein E
MNRVVITGAGTINALGHTVPETLHAMREGQLGIGPLQMRDLDRLSVKIGAQIKNFDPESHFDRQKLALYDRVTQLTLLASREAMVQSGLEITEEQSETTGVVLGTAAGGMNTWDDNFRSVYEEGKNRVHPFVVPKLMTNAAASHVSMVYNIKGPSLTVSTACASSNHAIGLAFQMVRSGMARVMLAGGADAMLTFGGIKAWEGLRVMSKTACRPFSANRSGMVQGEGAGVFVLETYEGAKARGAEILAEIVGFAMTSDASDIVMPNQQGAARAIRAERSPMRACLRKILAISTPMALEQQRMTKRSVRRWWRLLAPMRIG